MEENETSHAARTEKTRNVVILLEETNSYIASAKERMNDVIETFINQAQNSIKINDFSQIFKTVNVWVKLRPRKLSQYAEIIAERSTTEKLFVRYTDQDFISNVKEVLHENRLKIISTDHNIIECKMPKPNDQDIDIAVQKIKVLGNTARNSLAQVKADSIQRLQAALKNEYIEARDVKQAIDSIELIEQKFVAVLNFTRMEHEKNLAGKFFKYENDEAKDLHRAMLKRIKKDNHVTI